MVEKLENAKDVTTADGLPVRATHRAWGSTHQRWNTPELVSYSVLGVLDKDGRFRPIGGTEEYAQITDDDYQQLAAANDKGKPAEVFRTTDIQELHQAIVARAKTKEPAPPAK